jgi:hypothetical protein
LQSEELYESSGSLVLAHSYILVIARIILGMILFVKRNETGFTKLL